MHARTTQFEAVERKLQALDADLRLHVSEATTSSIVAIASLNKYGNALKRALDNEQASDEDKDLQWRQVTDSFDIQARDVSESNQKFTLARFVFVRDFFVVDQSINQTSFISI